MDTRRVGRTHHVKLGSDYFVCKFDSKSAFEKSYQQPFITRQSVAQSRSEGDYGQDLVFTQRSWVQGEGASVIDSNSEARYYDSDNVDVSGSSGGLLLMNDVEQVTTGVPSWSTGEVRMEPSSNGLIFAYPFNVTDTHTRYAYRFNGTTWTLLMTSAADTYTMTSMVASGDAVFLAYKATNLGRIAAGTYVNWASTVYDYRCLGTDNKELFAGYYKYDAPNNKYSCIFHKYPITGTPPFAATAVSAELEGLPVALKFHNGTMYALVVLEEPELSFLYKYDGTNFVPHKELPDGFIGQSLCSDGSVLYVGGKQKCAEGNYRGQIYYITGSGTSETLGNLMAFGVRDGSTNYAVKSMRSHGKSVYFPWQHYGGLGRYDSINGGYSASYRHNSTYAAIDITSIGFYKGDLYWLTTGSGANNTALWRNRSYVSGAATGEMDSGFIDFGLPATQKLYNSLTLTSPTIGETGELGSVDVYFAKDGNTSSWTLAGTPATKDSDSSSGFNKYTLALPSNGVKAHSLAYRLDFDAVYNQPENYVLNSALTSATNWSSYTSGSTPVGTVTYSADGVKIDVTDWGGSQGSLGIQQTLANLGDEYLGAEIRLTNVTGSISASVTCGEASVNPSANNGGWVQYAPGSGVSVYSADLQIYVQASSAGATATMEVRKVMVASNPDLTATPYTWYPNSAELSTFNSGSPIVSSVSVNAMTLVRSPGKVTPKRMWKLPLVLSKQNRTINGAIERGVAWTAFANLRTAFEQQNVVTLVAFDQPDTAYNVLITSLSEVSAVYSEENGYEATAEVECLEV